MENEVPKIISSSESDKHKSDWDERKESDEEMEERDDESQETNRTVYAWTLKKL